jgi:hypothetical protein
MNTSVTTPEFKLTAYPNPSTQAFNLKIEQQNHSDIQLDVLDINGRVIYTEKGTSTKLYRFGSEFKPGVYFVRVTQGKSIKTQKIIKL